ncbi:MAG: peptidoglycan-binding domain-containing protein [Methylomonas sp.]
MTSQPNADVAIAAGQCWIYGQIKPRPVEQTIEVTLKDSRTTIHATPAEIRQGFKQVVTREGTVTYRIEPPTYKQVLEKVLVRPEVTRYVVVPAIYEKREKNITVEEAKTVMERCRAAGTRYGRNTGAIAFCARELPAKQEVVSVQELVQPERTEVVTEPAEYNYVVRKVVDKPARVVEVILQPEVMDVPVEEVVTPSQTRQAEIPAVTQEMQVTTFEGEPRMVMRRAVCNDDITPSLITNLQEQLHQHGYQAGPVDGLLGQHTLDALSHYQVDNGLAVGAITYESLEHLGIAGR